MALIQPSLLGVQLLLKGGFYYFGAISLGDIDMTDSFFRVDFRTVKI